MPSYKALKHLGDGGFASVYLIHHPTFGRIAYKKLGGTNISDADLIRLKKEADIQLRFRHPNVVSLFEAQFVSPDIGLFLEYMQYGSVDTFIREYTVTWEWKSQMLYDVSLAMSYLHQEKPVIIHGDLKSQNILIGDGYRAKISDFGLSRSMQTKISSEILDHKLSGTIEYIAPEYLGDPLRQKTEKFDVHGFAISAWEIYSRKSFFRSFYDTKLIGIHVQNGTRPRMEDIKDRIPDEILKLIEECWLQNDDDRPILAQPENLFRIQRTLKLLTCEQEVHNCLQQTQQKSVADALDRGKGFAVNVRLRQKETKNDMEPTLIDLMTNYLNEPPEIGDCPTQEHITLKNVSIELESIGVKLLGSYNSIADGFIVCYFLVSTCSALEKLTQMCESGHLKKLLESVYRCLLQRPNNKSAIIKSVTMALITPSLENCGAPHNQQSIEDNSETFEQINENDTSQLIRDTAVFEIPL